MPRSFKLTWQPGVEGRSGRWRRKYRGKVYYFYGGHGKSDREAYYRAVEKWEAKKTEVDAAAPRQYQLDYEAEITVWGQVYAWSNRHGETATAQLAYEKQERLRALLNAPVLKPLTRDDRFRNLFEPVTIKLPDDLIERAGRDFSTADVKFAWQPEMSRETRERYLREMDGSHARIQKEIWNDRLNTQQRRATIRSNTVDEHVQEFLQHKNEEAAQRKLTLGRIYALQLHLFHFRDWIGSDAPISDIDSQLLKKYHTSLLDRIQQQVKTSPPPSIGVKSASRKKESRVWTSTTARHYLTTVKSFVRWLWEMEAIPALPRVLGHNSHSLKITPKTPVAIIFSNDEVSRLLEGATGRTKLFLLLMLNCGMTQKDVADLRKAEVDLESGRIVRKRSKTDKFDSVPTVNYLLWPETVQLLKQFVDQGEGDLALLNANGSSLWSEQFDSDGKYGKSDNIKNAFDRLKSKLKITKPLKSFKKTSSSKLRENERFNGLVVMIFRRWGTALRNHGTAGRLFSAISGGVRLREFDGDDFHVLVRILLHGRDATLAADLNALCSQANGDRRAHRTERFSGHGTDFLNFSAPPVVRRLILYQLSLTRRDTTITIPTTLPPRCCTADRHRGHPCHNDDGGTGSKSDHGNLRVTLKTFSCPCLKYWSTWQEPRGSRTAKYDRV